MRKIPDKIPARMSVDFDYSGKKTPVSFRVEDDERTFVIDKVLWRRKGASTKAGVQGILYGVRIMGQERTLCEEPNDCWSIIRV